MIQDIINSIKVTLHERFSNPLLGTFLISAAAFNYHFFLIIFSNEELADKFLLLEAKFNACDPYVWLRLILFPLLMTAFYIFALPYPSKRVYEFVRNRQKEILEIRSRTEDEFPLTQEEARELRSKHVQLESYYQRIINEKEQEISSYRNRQPDQASTTTKDISKEASISASDSNEIKIWNSDLENFKYTPERTSFQNNLNYLYAGTLDFTKIENFGDLAAWGIVDQDSNDKVRITEKGKYFARKLKDLAENQDSSQREEEARKKFNHLIEMIQTLARERKDFRRLSYNTKEIEDYLKSNSKLFEKFLPVEENNVLKTITKNMTITGNIVKGGHDDIDAYLIEVQNAINSINVAFRS